MMWYPKHTFSRRGKDTARCGDVTTNKHVFRELGTRLRYHEELKKYINVFTCFCMKNVVNL